MPDLSIRPATATEADARGIFALLMHMFDEGPMNKLVPNKALVEIARVCAQEAAWVVTNAENDIVASAGLVEGGDWYSDTPVLVTRWFYVMPPYRGADSAFGLLMEELRTFVGLVDMEARVDLHNPSKRTERKAGRLEAMFARFAFDPRGQRMRLAPAEAEKEAA